MQGNSGRSGSRHRRDPDRFHHGPQGPNSYARWLLTETTSPVMYEV